MPTGSRPGSLLKWFTIGNDVHCWANFQHNLLRVTLHVLTAFIRCSLSRPRRGSPTFSSRLSRPRVSQYLKQLTLPRQFGEPVYARPPRTEDLWTNVSTSPTPKTRHFRLLLSPRLLRRPNRNGTVGASGSRVIPGGGRCTFREMCGATDGPPSPDDGPRTSHVLKNA